MIYNRLGSSELEISSIGFGAMSLDLSNSKEAGDLIRYAFNNGVNYFDTADLYGRGENERLVGKVIKPFRKDVVLATKVGNRWSEDRPDWYWDVSSRYINTAIENSLKRLQTDYIDLYQIHGGTIEDNFDEVVETLESLVKVGKIRYYGISSIRPNVFSKFCKASSIVSNMMQYSILDNRPEQYYSLFEKANINIIARGTLAQGLLINKEPKPYVNLTKELVRDIQCRVEEYCQEFGVNKTSFALKYVLDRPVVASALVGSRTKSQFDDVLGSFEAIRNIEISFDTFDFATQTYVDHIS